MSLESYLNEQINGADSQSRIEMYSDAMRSEHEGVRDAGLSGLVAMAMLSSDVRYEDFVLNVEDEVTDENLQGLIAQYFTELGYEVKGDCNAWGEPMTLRKTDQTTKSVTVTNDSSFACKMMRMKGPIYVTVADWPYDE